MATDCSQQLTFWELGSQQVTVDFAGGRVVTDAGLFEVDPILWTKNSPSLATLLPAFLTGNAWSLLLSRPLCYIAFSPGETEVGSAGEHPAKG